MIAVRTLAILVLVVLLPGCGFQLRGQASLPFSTLYLPPTGALVVELRRNVAAGTQTKLVDQAKDAEAVFTLLHEVREKVILSLDTNGRVREFQLRYRVGFQVADLKGGMYIEPSEIFLTRDVTFNDAEILAKESEEGLLYRDMQTDMVQQMVRRIAASKRRDAD